MSTAATAGADRFQEDALLNLAARVDEVLSLQRHFEHQISNLLSSQAATHTTLTGLSQTIGGHQHVAQSLQHSQDSNQDAGAPRVNDRSSCVENDGSHPRLVHNMSSTVSAVSSAMMAETATRPGLSPSGLQRLTILDEFALDAAVVGAAIDMDEVEETIDRLMRSGPCGRGTSIRDIQGQRYIIGPHCLARISHDLLSIFVLAVDMMVALVVISWGLNIQGVLSAISFISWIFWVWDIFLSFITGYYSEGELVLRPSRVAVRYLKSWFVPDILIVSIDFVSFVIGGPEASSQGSHTGLFRLSKATRFLRLLRVCRILRMSDSLARLMDANIYLEIIVETIKPLLAILTINHILACAWWFTGSQMPSDTGLRWVDDKVSPDSEVSFIDAGFAFQYLTCMHWSLTQLTVGSMDIAPRNAVERAFNCCSLILGMLVFSSLISSISAKTMQHYLKQKVKLAKFNALRRFLRNRVSSGTVIAAQFQAKKAMFGNTGKPLTISQVDAITMLPQTLQRSIRAELCEKHLQHPLLRWWFVVDLTGAHALCHTGIDFIGLAAEDNLFFPRTTAAGAYVMVSGEASYMLESIMRFGMADTLVHQGRFFCEVALWCSWKHMGELTALTGAEVMLIRTAGLIRCLDQAIIVRHVIVQYARSFVKQLNAELLPEVEPPNDMAIPYTEFDSILPSLPVVCRQLVGAAAFSISEQRQGGRHFNSSTEVEVRAGACCLTMNWEGEVERIVSLVVLRLSHPDGRILARLGERSGDSMRAACELPGKKQMEGETPAQTYARLFQGPFAPFAGHLTCTGGGLEEAWKDSKRMHVKTKYLKTVNDAELACPVESLGLDATLIRRPRCSRRSRISNFGSTSAPIGAHRRATFISRKPSNEGSSNSGDHQPDLEIYCLADGAGNITFVGWLTILDFDFFTSRLGEQCLQDMMENVHLTPEIEEAAQVRYGHCQLGALHTEACQFKL